MSRKSSFDLNASHYSEDAQPVGYGVHHAGFGSDQTFSDGPSLGWQTGGYSPHTHTTASSFDPYNSAMALDSEINNTTGFLEGCLPSVNARNIHSNGPEYAHLPGPSGLPLDIAASYPPRPTSDFSDPIWGQWPAYSHSPRDLPKAYHHLPEVDPSLYSNLDATSGYTSPGFNVSHPTYGPRLGENTEGYQGVPTITDNGSKLTYQDHAQAYAPQPHSQLLTPTPTWGVQDSADSSGELLQNVNQDVYPAQHQFVPDSNTTMSSSGLGDKYPSCPDAALSTPTDYFSNHTSNHFLSSSLTPAQHGPTLPAISPTWIQPYSSGGNSGPLKPNQGSPSVLSGGSLELKPTVPSRRLSHTSRRGSKVNSKKVKKRHVARRPKVKKLQCHICHDRFEKPCELRRHVDAHEGNYYFMCKTCGEKLKWVTKDQVKIHYIKEHIRGGKRRGNEPTEEERAEAKNYVIELQ